MFRQASMRSVLHIAGVTALFGLLAWSNVVLTRGEGRIAAIWMPNAMLLAVMLRSEGRRPAVYLPFAFVANCLANLIAGDMPSRAIGLSLVNSAEISLAWAMMIRIGCPRPDMSILSDLKKLIGIAGFLAPFLSGLIAALVLDDGSLGQMMLHWSSWSLTDGLGMIILVPSLLAIHDAWTAGDRGSHRRTAEWFWISATGTAVILLLFWQSDYPLLFLAAPVVLVHAFRLGALGTAVAIIQITVIASVATSMGHGPLMLLHGGFGAKLIVLQLFVACVFAMGLPVAAMMAGQARIERDLEAHRDDMRFMLENMREILFRIDAEGRWTFLNPAWEAITGYSVAESLGWHNTRLLHPDDLAEAAVLYPRIFAGEIHECLLEQRFIRADGAVRYIEVSVRAIRDERDRFAGAIGNIRDVTEQKRAERALKESEARFRALSDSAPMAVFRTDPAGRVTYVNTAWTKLTGLSAQEALGDGWTRLIVDERADALIANLRDIQRPGDMVSRRRTLRRPDGRIVNTMNQIGAEFDENGIPCGYIGVIADVTAELAATAALTEAKRVFEDLSSLSPAGIFRTDAQGAVTYCNAAWLALSGLTQESAQGPGWAKSLHEDDRQRIWDEWAQAVAGQVNYRGEFRFVRPDGGMSWVDVIAAPQCDEDGRLVGFIGVNVDITERKRLEQQLLGAKRHAEQASIAKANFLANMSHEIRTPMNGVLGFTDLLLESELTVEQRRHAHLIADSGQAMMRLLNDILDISKVEAGQMTIAWEAVDLRHVLGSCVKLMSPTAVQKGLSIDLEVDASIAPRIAGDGLRLRQIVLNLIGNAIKFTAKGGIVVRARRAYGADHGIDVTVEDSGIGIPSERLEAIFTPFQQADESTARRYGGTGLGLTISRQLIELMGGTISVESETGRGSVFSVRLPERPMEDVLQPSPDEGHACGQRPDSSPAGLYVLVAEDHDVNQMLVTAMLQRLGCTVEMAADGAEAVARIDAVRAAGGPMFDLVLMDVQMPHIDGYQATRMIRARGITPDQLPIVALTANAYAEDVAACHRAGMQDHIAKPIERDALSQVLDRWAGQRRPALASAEAPAGTKATQGSIEERYLARRKEALSQLSTLVARGRFTDLEVTDMIVTLHKLAGTAGMFGEVELGERASRLETQLREWPASARADKIPEAAAAILKAA